MAPRSWGIPSWLLKVWYHTVYYKQISYAAIAWAQGLSVHAVRQLVSSQRAFLVRIARSYRTVSTPALNIITGIIPINLALQKEIKLVKIRLKQEINVNRITYTPYIFEPRMKTFDFDISKPVNLKIINSQKKITNDRTTVYIYTDGSKHQDSTTYAFCVIYMNKVIYEHSKHIFTKNTIFQAEIYAIFKAINWAINSKFQNFIIYTDSQSVVASLSGPVFTNYWAHKIYSLLELTNKHFKLGWVRAHKGNVGNELADTLANEAALQGQADHDQLSLPISYFKEELKWETNIKWQEFWDTSPKGRYTHTFISNINNIKHIPYFLISFITGHGPFPEYLHRIERLDSPDCHCGGMGSPFHYLYECPMTKSYHLGTQPSMGNRPHWLLKTLSDSISRGRILNIIQYLKKTYAKF